MYFIKLRFTYSLLFFSHTQTEDNKSKTTTNSKLESESQRSESLFSDTDTAISSSYTAAYNMSTEVESSRPDSDTVSDMYCISYFFCSFNLLAVSISVNGIVPENDFNWS